MSENGHNQPEGNEQDQATQDADTKPTPKAEVHRKASDESYSMFGGLATALPLLLSIGGALVASAATVDHNKLDRDGHDDSGEEDDDGWFSSLTDVGGSLISNGAKAAGIAGVLRAIGSGNVTGAAALAAKAIAAKKLAEYTAAAGSKSARAAARHPIATLGSTAAAYKARGYARTGYGRTRDAARVLRHGRGSVAPQSSAVGAAFMGLALLSVGAGFAYLFDKQHGEDRRRGLRESVGLGK